MDYATYVSSISFRFLQPDATRESDGRFALRRGARPDAKLLELPYAPVDVANTVLSSSEPVKRALRELCDMPRMSTVAIAAMINEAVTRMSPDHAFVNIGVWHGFSFLAAALNADKVCVGIDDFSQFGGPEASFRRRFETLKGANHRFYAMDYREYFSNVHRQPIGVYFYDGHHGYENQRHGLQVAEPFLADDCLVFVDDTNLEEVRRATVDFVANSRRTYRVLVDESTSTPEHPTLWNGIIVLQAGATTIEPVRELAPWREPAPAAPEVASPRSQVADDLARQQGEQAPLVSVIVHREQDDVSPLRDTVESALAQSWPAVEVLVADDRPGASAPSPEERSALGERVAVIRPDAEAGFGALDAALAESRGEFVSVVAAGARLPESAVRVGLDSPPSTRYWRDLDEGRYQEIERSLVAGEEILNVVPDGKGLIIVSERMKLPYALVQVRPRLRYPRQGGHPADDDHAIRDLEALRGRGAGTIVFLWPAFWWLDYYSGLSEHLRTAYRCVLENDRVIAFDLTG